MAMDKDHIYSSSSLKLKTESKRMIARAQRAERRDLDIRRQTWMD
jgi:hypothetical protein